MNSKLIQTNIFKTLILALLLGVMGFSSANTKPITAENTYIPKRIIVFGDSYSDNGNVYQLSKHQYPTDLTYYHGRFTDGLVWAEYLAKLLKLDPANPTQFIDLAYGYAKILSPASITVIGVPDKHYAIPDLASEIADYSQRYGDFKDEDLVVVFISTNDFFDISAISPLAPAHFSKAAEKLVEQIHRLITLKAQHIVVFNGRDVSLSPLATLAAKVNTNSSKRALINDYLSKFKQLIKNFNQQLSNELSSMDKNKLAIYDVFHFDQQLVSETQQFNADTMCYQNEENNYQHVAGSICENPDQFFYYDLIHTTDHINELLAKEVYQQVQSQFK